MKKKNLFVFTKNFPFGSSEQYIVEELGSLISKFDKVVFVPSEYFGDVELKMRQLPERCEVLLINQLAAKTTTHRNWLEFSSVFLFEFFHSRNKIWVLKNRERFFSVLLHQMKCASVFTKALMSDFEDYDCYFYAYWIHNSSILLGLLKRRKIIKDFVCRGHAIDLYEWDWDVIRFVDPLPYYNFIIKQASRLFSISGHGAKYLKSRFPKYSDKIFISRLGVTDKGINPNSSTGAFVIVSCSGINERKRVNVIAEVVSQIKIPVKWIHFGDGEGMEELKKKIIDIPFFSNVELRGFVKNEEIMSFYSSNHVDLFINISEAEGIPVSIMEAISFGIPVFATDVNGNPEIANAETGFVVPFVTSSREMAEIIVNYAQNKSKQQQLRESARIFYFKKFSATSNFEQFADDLLKLD